MDGKEQRTESVRHVLHRYVHVIVRYDVMYGERQLTVNLFGFEAAHAHRHWLS